MSDPTSATSTGAVKAPAWLGKKIGNFKLLAVIGQGAMGRIFRAEDIRLQRQVALKVLSKDAIKQNKAHYKEQFIREARAAAALEHPNIVRIHEVNEQGDILYIAMELVEGGNLRELVEASGPMDIVRACTLVAEAADALHYAHEMGVIHRDIKPANLIVARNGRCKLADFGLARMHDPSDTFNLPSEAVGTPQFIAPEVVKGKSCSVKSDIYSLGATLWYLLVGHPPFMADSAADILKMQVNTPLPDLKKLRTDVPDALVQIVQKALAKDPADRFDNVLQFAKALRVQTIPRGASMVSDLGSGVMILHDTGAKKRAIALISVAAVLVVAAMGVIFWFSQNQPAPTPPSLQASAPSVETPQKKPEPVVEAPKAVVPAPAVVEAPKVAPAAPPASPKIENLVQATDEKALTELAGKKGVTTVVEGVVEEVRETSGAKFVRIYFENVGTSKGFYCGFPITSDVGKKLAAKFGGEHGEGLKGKKIRVTGSVEMYRDRPQIFLKSAEQVQLVEP